MERIDRVRKKIGILLVLLMAALLVPDVQDCVAATKNSWKIECASYDAPKLKAYLYGAKKWDSIKFTSASLQPQSGDARELTFINGTDLAQTGEGTEYIYLVDVTASMRAENVAVAQANILEQLETLVGNDRLIVYIFGGKAKKVTEVTGEAVNPAKSKNKKKAKKAQKTKDAAKKAVTDNVVKGKGDGRGSTIYSAMETVMDFTAQQDGKGKSSVPLRKVCLLLTDGLDRDFGSKDKITFEDKIQQSHVAFYGIGMADQNGSKGSFTQLEEYCSISGGDWTYEPGEQALVDKAVKNKRKALLNCFAVEFEGANNLVSNANEVLTITTKDNRSSSKTLLANKYQKDKKAPKAKKIKKVKKNNNEISFQFTEAVIGADKKQNIIVKDEDGETMAVKSASYDDDTYKCEVVFQDDLYSGEYKLSFKNVTDNSMEENPAKGAKFDFDGKSRLLGTLEYILYHFWWVIVLAAFFAGGAVIYRAGGVMVEDGKIILKKNLKPPKVRKLHMTLESENGEVSEIIAQMDGSIYFGRHRICNFSYPDTTLSGQHFVIEDVNGVAYISDLESVNGTFVNGSRITKDHELHANDRISAGKQTFIFHNIQ